MVQNSVKIETLSNHNFKNSILRQSYTLQFQYITEAIFLKSSNLISSKYESCLEPCPKTCQNRFDYDKIESECHAGACVEGCSCGEGNLWDENVNRCVNETDCTCGILNGHLYREGDLVSEISDDCQERVSICKLVLRSRLALRSRPRLILVPKQERAKIW